MVQLPRTRMLEVVLSIGLLFSAGSVLAQNIVVDATPSDVVNTFSPPHALGGAIDRLRPGEGADGREVKVSKEWVDKNTDTLLSDPVQRNLECRLADGHLPPEYGTHGGSVALERGREVE